MPKMRAETEYWLNEAKKGSRPYGYVPLGRGAMLLSAASVPVQQGLAVSDRISGQGYMWWKALNGTSRKLRCFLEVIPNGSNITWNQEGIAPRGKNQFFCEIGRKNPDAPVANEHEWTWAFEVVRNGIETVVTTRPEMGLKTHKLESCFFVTRRHKNGRLEEPHPSSNIEKPEQSRLRKWIGSNSAILAIVFTDIVGSTKLGRELGDKRMKTVRDAHYAQVSSLLGRQVFVVKKLGDGFLLVFRTVDTAFSFAQSLTTKTGHERITVRVGIHVGPVDATGEDVHGSAVNYAQRVCAQCCDGGIWISEEAKRHVDQVKGKVTGRWVRHPNCKLKGFCGKHTLWELDE